MTISRSTSRQNSIPNEFSKLRETRNLKPPASSANPSSSRRTMYIRHRDSFVVLTLWKHRASALHRFRKRYSTWQSPQLYQSQEEIVQLRQSTSGGPRRLQTQIIICWYVNESVFHDHLPIRIRYQNGIHSGVRSPRSSVNWHVPAL